MGRLHELERDRQISDLQALMNGPSPADDSEQNDDVRALGEVSRSELTGFGDGFEAPRGAFRARLAAHRRSAGVFVAVAVMTAAATALVGWFLRPAASPVPASAATIASANERSDRVEPSGSAAPSGAPSSGSQSPAAVIVVAVVGQVQTPGLVTLAEGSRVSDALAAAGGALPGVDLTGINIARKLVDGEQIAVGVPGVPAENPGGAASGSGDGASGGETAAGQPININTASASQLDELPGVGPVIAQRIVDFRSDNGPFKSVDELANVSGIGPSIMEKVKAKVTV